MQLYINPISTEFQYRLWLVSFLLLALTNLELYVFSSFSMLQQCYCSLSDMLALHILQTKMKRIKLAYEHLAQKNKAYRARAAYKCRCGYLASTLWELDKHQQCGYTEYTGHSTSYNRSILCCLCNDGTSMRYNVKQFSTHMSKQHNVTARISFPVVNPCPFCSFSGHQNVTTVKHILNCQKMFNPDHNLSPIGTFDLPLLSNSSQPRYSASVPQNALQTSSNLLTGKRIAVSNMAARVAAPLVVHSPVRPVVLSCPVPTVHPVPVALFTGVREHGISFTSTSSAATNMLLYPGFVGSHMSDTASGVLAASHMSVPARMPVVPVGIYGSGLGPPTLMSCTSSSLISFHMQQPNVNGSHSAMNLALNDTKSVPVQLHRPLMSVLPLTSVNGTAVVKVNVPNTMGQWERGIFLPLQNFTSAAGQTSSTSRKIFENLQTKVTSKVSGHHGILPKKRYASVSSARKPVVVLRRLSVSACEVCGLVFQKPELLCHHLHSAHNIAVDEKHFVQGNLPKSLSCSYCCLKFFSKQGLDRHIRIVHGMTGVNTCRHCSATGISDLFEHFHLKHDISVRKMVQWRVCHICRLNFSTVTDVEKHVLSAHSDIFPTRLHFHRRVQAAGCSRNLTPGQTQRNLPVDSGKNSIACSDHAQPMVDMNRKHHNSVTEIAEDTSEPKSDNSRNVQAVDKKEVCGIRKLSCITNVEKHVLSAHRDVSTTPLHNFPQTVQASVSSRNLTTNLPVDSGKNSVACSDHLQSVVDMNMKCHCSVIESAEDSSDLKLDDSRNVQAEDKKRKRQNDNVADLTPDNAVAVFRTPGSKPATKRMRRSSSVSAGHMNCRTPDVPMALSPRNKAHEQHSPCLLDKDAVLGTVSRITKNNSVVLRPLTEETKSSINSADNLSVSPKVNLIPLSSVHDADSSSVSDVSIHIKPVDSHGSEELSGEKGQSVHGTVTAVAEGSRKSSGNSTSKPNGSISDVSICDQPLNSLGLKESSVKKDTVTSKKSIKTSNNSKSRLTDVSDFSVCVKPLNSIHIEESSAQKDKGQLMHVGNVSVVPPKSSGTYTSKPTNISDVSVHIKPVDSTGAEESLVKEDKGRYRYVFNVLPVIINFLLTSGTFVIHLELLIRYHLCLCMWTITFELHVL